MFQLLLLGRQTFGNKVQLSCDVTEYLFTNDLSVLLRLCLSGLEARLTVSAGEGWVQLSQF